MIAILGDLHFRSDKEYFIEIGENIIKWFSNWKYNSPENELILAGDLVEQATPGGITISFLERFTNASKFKKIHICVGNHDDKKINGIQQLAYEFLNNKPNIIIYKTSKETTIQNKKVLILPYFSGLNDLGLTMKEYYSSIPFNRAFSNDYDLIVGHFSGDDVFFKEAPDCIQNLDNLKGRVCLGHIHTREVNPDRYIGSVYAGKKTENDYTRAAWILDDQGSWSEDPLPVFNEFISITYPNELPSSKAMTPVYTILNCGSEAVAKQKYGNIYLRRISSDCIDFGLEKKLSLDRSFESIREFNLRDLFEEFVKTSNLNLNEEVILRCRNILKSENILAV